MKKEYNAPELKEEQVEIEDIIAASALGFAEEGDTQGLWPGFGNIWG